MDFKRQNTKNLMSKDLNAANKECKNILDNCDVEAFSDLCENSEFIFDFIKTKINKNFLNNVTQDNYLNLLKFTKIYCEDFEDFIVKGLVKFADEDLTDNILELFENGSYEEKAYCAKYFYYIQDPLSLDLLREYALCDFSPLSYNCAQTLNKFEDRVLYDKEIEILKNGEDDFEKIKAVYFLTSFGDKNAFNPMYDYMKISPFTGDVVEALLSLKSLFEIEENKALIIFNNLLDSYPEFISLETLIPYNVGEYLKTIISKEKTPYISYILFKAKSKFNLILDNEIYTYDLSKEAKEEIKEISKVLASDSGNRENNFKELLKENDAKIVENVLDTITDENIKSCKDEVKHLSLNSDNEIIIYKSLNALKTFGEELPQMELDKIQNENIKALIESLY